MEKTGFALFSPQGGWWQGMDPATGRDKWCDDLVNACIMGSENTALEYCVAIADRDDGRAMWVYQVFFVRRQLGRRW